MQSMLLIFFLPSQVKAIRSMRMGPKQRIDRRTGSTLPDPDFDLKLQQFTRDFKVRILAVVLRRICIKGVPDPCIYTVFLTGKSPNIRPYTVHIPIRFWPIQFMPAKCSPLGGIPTYGNQA